MCKKRSREKSKLLESENYKEATMIEKLVT